MRPVGQVIGLIPVLIQILGLLDTQCHAQDTVTVTANNPPVWGPDLALVEEVRIGCLEGPEECSFGDIQSAAISADGTLFVGDKVGPVIRRFERSGIFAGQLGRDGEGPGEYRRIGGMATLSTGGLAVWDHPNQRVTVFDSSGEYSHSFRATNQTPSADLRADTAGNIYLRALSTVALGRLGVESPEVWVKYSPDGQVLDSLAIPMENTRGPNFYRVTENGSRWPFSIKTLSDLSPFGYQVVGRNFEYSVHRPLPDGRVLRIDREYSPIPVETGERSEWEATQSRLEKSGLAEGLHRTSIPTQKPPFRSLWVDGEGRIWVARYVEAHPVIRPEGDPPSAGGYKGERWLEPSVWDVLDPRGTLLGIVETPPRTNLIDARGMRIWVVEKGQFDEEYVVRYRIEAGRPRLSSNTGRAAHSLRSWPFAGDGFGWRSIEPEGGSG